GADRTHRLQPARSGRSRAAGRDHEIRGPAAAATSRPLTPVQVPGTCQACREVSGTCLTPAWHQARGDADTAADRLTPAGPPPASNDNFVAAVIVRGRKTLATTPTPAANGKPVALRDGHDHFTAPARRRPRAVPLDCVARRRAGDAASPRQ